VLNFARAWVASEIGTFDERTFNELVYNTVPISVQTGLECARLPMQRKNGSEQKIRNENEAGKKMMQLCSCNPEMTAAAGAAGSS
jgi:hypothetical protein